MSERPQRARLRFDLTSKYARYFCAQSSFGSFISRSGLLGATVRASLIILNFSSAHLKRIGIRGTSAPASYRYITSI